MNLKSSVIPYLFYFLILLLSFLDLILYNSYLVIFISLAVTVLIVSSYFIISKIQNIIYVSSILILIYSFYCFTIAPYSLNLEENAFFTLGALIFASLVLLYTGNNSQSIKMNYTGFDKFLFAVIFFTLLISNTVINNKEITEPQGMLKMVTVGGSLIIFGNYFSCYLYKNNDIRLKILKAIAVIGILSAVFGLLTIVMPGIYPNNQYPGLSISFYKHPNATSSIYNFSIPIILWFLIYKFRELNFTEKIFYVSGFFLSLISLVFTFSRFGIVTVLLSCLILVYKYSKKLFGLIVILIMMSFSFIIANFFSTKGSITVLGRIGLVETAFEMFKSTSHFLFGYGGITTRKVFEDVKLSLSVGDLNNNPHNIILYSILLYGIIFSSALYLFYFKYYFRSFIIFFKNKTSDLFILSLAVCSGIFIKNMGEDLLFFQEFFMWYLFLIFFGFIVIESNIIRISNREIK